jgi:hypothetical protein
MLGLLLRSRQLPLRCMRKRVKMPHIHRVRLAILLWSTMSQPTQPVPHELSRYSPALV